MVWMHTLVNLQGVEAGCCADELGGLDEIVCDGASATGALGRPVMNPEEQVTASKTDRCKVTEVSAECSWCHEQCCLPGTYAQWQSHTLATYK
jgi:hypothetical protein